MTFRDQIAADLTNVFLNTEEFGQVRDFDGTNVRCVRVDEEDSPNGRGQESERRADGVFTTESTIFVRRADLSSVPVVGQRITLDGAVADVVNVAEAEGLLSFRLQWFDS